MNYGVENLVSRDISNVGEKEKQTHFKRENDPHYFGSLLNEKEHDVTPNMSVNYNVGSLEVEYNFRFILMSVEKLLSTFHNS